MKTIIAGMRTFDDYQKLCKAMRILTLGPITEVVSGGARGADALGERWAKENGIPLVVFPADWDKYGNRAGMLRNIQMAEYADALVAIWDGRSRGTGHMIEAARKHGLHIHVFYPKQPE